MRNVTFGGMIPKINTQALPTNAAVFASNCILYGGEIRPIMQASDSIRVVTTDNKPLKNVRAMRVVGDMIVGWDTPTEHTQDVLKRAGEDSFLFVKDGEIFRSSSTWVADKLGAVKLGVCPPKEAPVAVVTGDCTPLLSVESAACLGEINDKNCNDDKDKVALAFCYTYVTPCQEESQPSPFSEVVFMNSDRGIFLANPNPLGIPDNVTEIRWYVLLTAEKTSHPFYIGSTTPQDLGLDYCYGQAMIGEILQSQTYAHPPACLQGIAVVGEATTLVWHSNEIWLSEPRQPHAYPEAFRFTLDPGVQIKRAVTLSTMAEGRPYWYAVLLTNSTPYLIQGKTPEAVVITRISKHAPCINPAGVAVFEDKVFFASEEGVMVMANSSLANMLVGYLDRRTWGKYKSPELTLGVHDGRLVALHPTCNGFMCGLSESDSEPQKDFVELTPRGTAGVQHNRGLLVAQLGGAAAFWEQGNTPLVAEWRSKDYVQSGLWHGTAAKVTSSSRPDVIGKGKEVLQEYLKALRTGCVTGVEQFIFLHPEAKIYIHLLAQSTIEFSVYNDGELYYTRPIITNRAVRIRRSNRRLVWGYGVKTQVPITEIQIQTSKDDLTQEGGHA